MKLLRRRDKYKGEVPVVQDTMAETAVADIVDTREFSRLYAKHCRRIHGLLIRLGVASHDAEDALHDTFMVAWRRLESLRDPKAFGAWLNGIAVRVAAASRRRARVRRFVGLDTVNEPAEPMTPASALEAQCAHQLVQRALDGMADKKRTVFVLFELQEMTGQEIALAVGCPLKTVWTRLFHARREFLARVAALEAAEARHEKVG